ncbi:MAG TPA: RCC1 repeat-containing protein, partial [Myxococcaceae bacterium]|nr:RCC1 repeat-containing protein [Myxococcaceae bacterium]
GVTHLAMGRADSVARRSDGTVWTWGDNCHGQLGDGTLVSRFVPAAVAGVSNIVAIAAGFHHTLVQAQNGMLSSWGSNDSGQLGLGPNDFRSSPGLVEEWYY